MSLNLYIHFATGVHTNVGTIDFDSLSGIDRHHNVRVVVPARRYSWLLLLQALTLLRQAQATTAKINHRRITMAVYLWPRW